MFQTLKAIIITGTHRNDHFQHYLLLKSLFTWHILPSVAKKHAWVTDIRPTEGNVHELANRGGRARWKIENEGFNDQKTHDYDLEHVYGNHPNAWKNYYQLLQIAHMIVQLMCCGDLCTKLHQMTTGKKTSFLEYYSSVKEFIESLKSAFRYLRFSLLSTQLPGRVQIRFSSA